ncbi:MAG: amidohydrolase family protein [Gemmatimonadales bacterium]
MTQIDINTFVGTYPFHDTVKHDVAELSALLSESDTKAAWVSQLDAIYRQDSELANRTLYADCAGDARVSPIPSLDPDDAGWRAHLDEAVSRGAPAVRSDPSLCGMPAADESMRVLLAACAECQLPLMMAVRLEDLRQRDPADPAQDLPPWAVRQLIRSHPAARLIITHADRDFIEQVHFGSTPDEAGRILWDISWIWGPPEDHLELLLQTVGRDRFCFGSGVPLRLGENAIAKLDLLDPDPRLRQRILAENLEAFLDR